MGRNRDNTPLDPKGQFDDDRLLWEKVTQSVKKIRSQSFFQPLKHTKEAKTELKIKNRAVQPQSVQTGQVKAKIAHVKPKPTDFRLGDKSGIDRSSARRLQRGQVLIEDRLDLHGLSQEQAHKKLNAFIGRAVQQNSRHVLIITGKGRNGHGILRHKVPEWLKDAPLCNHVNAISYAQPKDGGKGALYIRLKRQRGENK